MKEYFEGESKIKKIGGRLKSDYYSLRDVVIHENESIIPLFYYLGLAKEENKDRILDALPKGTNGAASLFLDEKIKEIEEGKLKLENVISKSSILKEYDTKEKKESQMRRAIRTRLSIMFKKTVEKWERDYEPSPSAFYGTHSQILSLCRDAIKLTPSGLAIDVEKFIDLYSDFIAADESTTRKHHQEAADALNRFFNGAVAITDKEIAKYFLLEDGIVKVRIESVNKKDYARLGKRIFNSRNN